MVVIQCPHCSLEVELDDGISGLFEVIDEDKDIYFEVEVPEEEKRYNLKFQIIFP